jgi:hypothetical protein
MPSLFQKSSPKNRWLKVLAFGETGTGKTIFALTFPQPRVADMEGGTLHYQGRKVIPGQSSDFEVLQTGSAMKCIKAVEQTVEEFAAHLKDPDKAPRPCMSFVVDPMTVFWQRLQEAYIEKMEKGNDFSTGLTFRDWGPIKRPLKNLMTDLVNLPMHVIMTAHEGNEYEQKGKELTVVGVKAKTEGDTPYTADTVLRFLTVTKEGVGNMVECVKDRTGVLTRGKTYENVTFDTWKEYLKGTQSFAPAPAMEKPGDLSEDQAIFNNTNVDSNETGGDNASGSEGDGLVATFINEEALKTAMNEMDWPLAKRQAMAKRFKTMDEWKAFLREALKEHRSEKKAK